MLRAEAAAEKAEVNKRRKYSALIQNYPFVLFAVETLGPWSNSDVLEDDNYTFFQITDNNVHIGRLFYGDLTNMKDMFLPPLDEIPDSESEEDNTTESTTEKNDPDLKFEYLNETNSQYDIKEFNEITKVFNNATRRYRGRYHGWNDPEDPRYFFFWTMFYVAEEELEIPKKNRLININIQYLIHTRYQVKKALIRKNPIRSDKRYRLGYLFNRLKRIKFEQQKLVSYANEQRKSYYRDLTSQIRLYEKMVRFDVDITDTIKLIRDIDNETNEFLPYVHDPDNNN